MAALFLTSEAMQGISSLSGIIEDKMFEIISLLDSRSHADLVKQITSNFTKSALLENRRKIFDVAVVKARERVPLATANAKADKGVPVERPSFATKDPTDWRLANRGTKPKIAVDIISMAMYVDDAAAAFPFNVLYKCTPKEKAVPNQVNETDTGIVHNTNTSSEGTLEATGENGKKDTSAHTATPPVTHVLPLVALEKRSIATQTDDPLSEVESMNVSFVCQNECCRNQFALTDSRKESDTCSSDSRVSSTDSCEEDEASISVGPYISTPESEPTPVLAEVYSSSTPNKYVQRDLAEDSLLEYIDAEYETVRKNNPSMCADRRKQTNSREHEHRIVSLEAKYERVIKRLDFVEKDHTREICEIRAEQRRQAYMYSTKNSESSYVCDTNDSIMITPGGSRDNDQGGGSFISGNHVDSSWDTESPGPVVLTQNYQGEQVTTKATPLHIAEMNREAKRVGAMNTGLTNRPTRPNSVQQPNKGRVNTAPVTSTTTSRPGQPFSLKGPHNEICVTLDPLGKNTA